MTEAARLAGVNLQTKMRSNKFPYIFILAIAIFINTVFLISCSNPPSKGEVTARIHRDIQIGTLKTEVLKYIETLEINGIKAVSSDYIKNNSVETFSVNQKNADIDGTINIEFRGRGALYCGTFVIFQFDKSGKLVNYIADDIFC
jgi:hypothetical protein